MHERAQTAPPRGGFSGFICKCSPARFLWGVPDLAVTPVLVRTSLERDHDPKCGVCVQAYGRRSGRPSPMSKSRRKKKTAEANLGVSGRRTVDKRHAISSSVPAEHDNKVHLFCFEKFGLHPRRARLATLLYGARTPDGRTALQPERSPRVSFIRMTVGTSGMAR
jgi:hypothetical protein